MENIKRQEKAFAIDKQFLQKYVGEYNLGEQIVILFVKENILMVLISGQNIH